MGEQMAKIRVGINGFGRIGRNFFRAHMQRGGDFEIVAANDLGDANTMAHLLQYDSVLGPLGEEVHGGDGSIKAGDFEIKMFAERDPAALPWGDLGVDVVLECTGSKSALDMALRTAKAGGRIVVSGIPGAGADLTPLWFRELELVGAYTATADDFATAIQAAGNLPHLEQLVGATYPLASWRDAIDHAMSAGALGTFKVAFRPQD